MMKPQTTQDQTMNGPATQALTVKNLSDTELLANAKKIAKEERSLTTLVILHIKEVHSRNLHFKLGYPNIMNYVMSDLGYSRQEAHRRVAAADLLRSLPEEAQAQTCQALDQGTQTLSNLVAAQQFFKEEHKKNAKEYTHEERADLVKTIEGKSRREVERDFASRSPSFVPSERRDQEKPLSATETRITFTAGKELVEKLEKIRALIWHKNPNATYEELFLLMADETLKVIDPEKREERRQARRQAKERAREQAREQARVQAKQRAENQAENQAGGHMGCQEKSQADGSAEHQQESAGVCPPADGVRRQVPPRTVPRPMRDELWVEAGARCTGIDPKTGERCKETRGLQIEHRHPWALGGRHEKVNLQILCSQCNRAAAIRVFGAEKMAKQISGFR